MVTAIIALAAHMLEATPVPGESRRCAPGVPMLTNDVGAFLMTHESLLSMLEDIDR